MTNSKILGSVTKGLGIGQSTISHPLKPVTVDSRDGVLHEITFDGGDEGQEGGLPGVLAAFGVPGIKAIDTPSMHGIQTRKMTRVPASGLVHEFNFKTGMMVVSYNMKAPSVIPVDQENILGDWDADGWLLVGHVSQMALLTQISRAIYEQDLAMCRGRPEGGIGSKTFRMIRVSVLSDAERRKFATYDLNHYRARRTSKEGDAHQSAGVTTEDSAEADPTELPASERLSA